MSKAIMVQGSSSGVGKSMIAMAIARHFKKSGLKVAPFKSQNMSLNSAVSIEGGEMSRAQYVQAIAAGAVPSVKMNPILIKPESGCAQLIVKGRPYGQINSNYYMNSKKNYLWKIVTESLNDLMSDNDIVVIEGAGSPAEINLKNGDIVNMSVAKAAHAPVILVADIDKGGAFAQVVGTMALLKIEEKGMVAGFIFNKFRGDISLLENYPQKTAESLGINYFGTMPYTPHRIAQEDEFILPVDSSQIDDLKINIIRLPYMANFDDFDPLLWNANIKFIQSGKIDADLLIIPGTKQTFEDLKWLKRSGLADEIIKAHLAGTTIFGICGGYQMLGIKIADNKNHKNMKGLGLLPVNTIFQDNKRTSNLEGTINLDEISAEVKGYEIHHGITEKIDSIKPFIVVKRRNGKLVKYEDGAYSNHVCGTYFHGMFQNIDFTEKFLNAIRKRAGFSARKYNLQSLDSEIDRFTRLFECSIDTKKIDDLVGL